jgi:hypothetical protein
VTRSRAKGCEVPVHKLTHTSDKVLRIQALQPAISSGAIRFSRRHTVLLEQLRQFPHAAHDDGPDALEMAMDAAKVPPFFFTVVEMSPDQAYAKSREERWQAFVNGEDVEGGWSYTARQNGYSMSQHSGNWQFR